MMGNYDAYRVWAPDEALWMQWAKPVLFTTPPLPIMGAKQDCTTEPEKVETANWASYPDGETALIVDLPGESGVLEGLALAKMGYRPVPLYNGVYGPNRSSMVIDVAPIANALFLGADDLVSMSLRADAPPVFLLDANRMQGAAHQHGKYDNRWCVFPQDMPSASFFLQQGIRQIYLRSENIGNDLAHILYRYQEKRIEIYHIDRSGVARKLNVVRPSHFKSLSYRIRTMTGLIRNSAGGFGGAVPEAMQSSGTRYYGIG